MRSYRLDGKHVDTPDPGFDTTSRTAIELQIAKLRTKQERMPTHWVDRRAQVGDEIDGLVDLWLAAEA